MEIAEDAEEDIRANRQSTVPEERHLAAGELSIIEASVPLPASRSTSPTGLPPSTSYRSIISDLETYPPPPRERQEPDIQSLSPSQPLDEDPKSIQSTRPGLYSYTPYGSNGKH